MTVELQDNNNPQIACTVRELAFVAWQIKRNSFHAEGINLSQTGSSWDEFSKWWDGKVTHYQAFGSIRDACWQAWEASMVISQPNHGSLNHFNDWWQTVLDDQPKTA